MFSMLGFKELEFGTEERNFKANLRERDLKNPGDRHSFDLEVFCILIIKTCFSFVMEHNIMRF